MVLPDDDDALNCERWAHGLGQEMVCFKILVGIHIVTKSNQHGISIALGTIALKKGHKDLPRIIDVLSTNMFVSPKRVRCDLRVLRADRGAALATLVPVPPRIMTQFGQKWWTFDKAQRWEPGSVPSKDSWWWNDVQDVSAMHCTLIFTHNPCRWSYQ